MAAAAAPLCAADGWKPLYNGHNLDGWWWWPPGKGTPPEPSWTVENGILRTTPDKGTRVYLITKESFTDFELAWDWKIEKAGNSGIKYRVQKLINFDGPRPEPGGLEYQMADDESNPDALSDAKHSTAAIYSYVTPNKPKLAGPNVWHSARILARGLHIEHWLNGVKVVDVNLDAPETIASFRASERKRSAEVFLKHEQRTSQIALQFHDGAAWFHDLKIRAL
ncbi:MAG: DUF1080 domain-containing protein [Bryobacteraceae bacterium]|nr:DUF1080 domain-containing protein [Bryobacteraceae bacterium]